MSEYKKTLHGKEFHTVNDAGNKETWKVRGDNNDGGYLAVQQIEHQEYVRRFQRTDNGWVCVDDPDEFTSISYRDNRTYVPQEGHQVLVDFGDLGFQVERITGVSEDGRFLMLFEGKPGEQCAVRNHDGDWFLETSGNRVFLLNSYAAPEVNGVGFVLPLNDEPVQEWEITRELRPDTFSATLHGAMGCTDATVSQSHDGMWLLDEEHPIYLISADQVTRWNGTDTTAAPETEGVPLTVTGLGPVTGDLTTRVIDGVALLYRVKRVLDRPTLNYKVGLLSLVGEIPGQIQNPEIFYTPDGGWQWNTGEQVTFTSSHADDLAWKATRLDSLHKILRANYFHFEAMAHIAPDGISAANMADFQVGRATAGVIRDEYAKQLFHVETGLLPEQAEDRFNEFHETLHDEYLASLEH